MTTTEILREEVKQYIDQADDKSLRMVNALLEIRLEVEEENDEVELDDLPVEH